MTIDIIDLTLPEYSSLNAVQISMVRSAQVKKNKIMAAANDKLMKLMFQMIGNNTARSTVYQAEKAAITAQAEADVEVVLEDLKLLLAYDLTSADGNESGPYRYPENPNYNLTASERFLAVRTYYMEATSDPNARLQAYAMDTLARSYLGEYYQTLYELLASYCK